MYIHIDYLINTIPRIPIKLNGKLNEDDL